MTPKPSAQAPESWKRPDPDLLATAKQRALLALKTTGTSPAQQRLAWFYDSNGNYAGASFADLRPIDPWDLTATDLHATMLLSVRIGPRATRRIVEEGATRAGLLRKLGQVPELDLTAAEDPELSAMTELYEAVKHALSADGVRNPNPWVTASKLCARKRPGLFPVRDRQVCDYLGLSFSCRLPNRLAGVPESRHRPGHQRSGRQTGGRDIGKRTRTQSAHGLFAAAAAGRSDLDLCHAKGMNRNARRWL
jgi:hypothetical protein